MRYGTLFSGIEGFGRGFDEAGMECAFQCEIDSQASDVLRYHYPEVPRWTDVTEVDPDELPDVDVLAFGSPCQDLSVAGRRAGLDGERSGLFVEAIRIADRLAPDWLVFENVPGLFSSQRGEDFAVVLEGITGFRPAVPEGGWRSAGFCVGPLRWAVWRVCDTQFWGPPQRRRRVFVVAGARGVCRPEVLLEPESLPWDPPPSREAGQGVAHPVAGSLTGSGRGVERTGESRGLVMYRPSDYTTGDFTEDDRTGALTGMTDQSRGGMVLTPFDTTQITPKANYSRQKPGDPRHPLAAGVHPPAVAYAVQERAESENVEAGPDGAGFRADVAYTLEARSRTQSVTAAVPRRLTARECERLQGFPDDWTRYGRKPDGEVYEQADSPRYRQLGNAVSVPVARWIGRRIMEVA